MSAPPVRVVALDLGGVLVDVDKGGLARRLGADAAVIERAFFGDDTHGALGRGTLDADGFCARVGLRLGRAPSDVHDAWATMVRARPGAHALVARVSCPTVPWSNTDPIHAEALARALGPLLGAPARALSHEVGALKPEAAFFRAALARLDVAPAAVLFVDDRDENVAAARDAGCRAEVARDLDELARVLDGASVLRPAP